MTPSERARAFTQAANLLPTLPAFAGTLAATMICSTLHGLARAQVDPVVFRQPCPGRWQIGRTDQLHEFTADLAGLRAAWLAIDTGRHGAVQAAQFAAPGTRYAAAVVRRAIRSTAADWARIDADCPALASVLADLVTVAGGLVVYRPRAGWPAVITR